MSGQESGYTREMHVVFGRQSDGKVSLRPDAAIDAEAEGGSMRRRRRLAFVTTGNELMLKRALLIAHGFFSWKLLGFDAVATPSGDHDRDCDTARWTSFGRPYRMTECRWLSRPLPSMIHLSPATSITGAVFFPDS